MAFVKGVGRFCRIVLRGVICGITVLVQLYSKSRRQGGPISMQTRSRSGKNAAVLGS